MQSGLRQDANVARRRLLQMLQVPHFGPRPEHPFRVVLSSSTDENYILVVSKELAIQDYYEALTQALYGIHSLIPE